MGALGFGTSLRWVKCSHRSGFSSEREGEVGPWWRWEQSFLGLPSRCVHVDTGPPGSLMSSSLVASCIACGLTAMPLPGAQGLSRQPPLGASVGSRAGADGPFCLARAWLRLVVCVCWSRSPSQVFNQPWATWQRGFGGRGPRRSTLGASRSARRSSSSAGTSFSRPSSNM
jgi:hypothetical protein